MPDQNILTSLQAEVSQLKKENEMLRSIIALIPGNVFWKDKEGYYLGCNNNVAQILGLSSPNEIVGKLNSDLFDPQLASLVDSTDVDIQDSALEKFIEEPGLNIYKQPAIYLSKKLPLTDDTGQVMGILGVSFDITKRKKMEEDLKIAKEKAEASNQAKSQFLAVVNHELRTPLTSIIGLLSFLKQDDLSGREEKKIINAIEDCTQHLLGLVNDVLDLSRLETGKYTFTLSPTSVGGIVQEVYKLLKPLAKNKGIGFHLHMDHSLPTYIETDPLILRQILMNLVGNAIKFTAEGQVAVKIVCLKQCNKKTKLQISVKDTGQGIPKDKLKLIFEPFQQLEDAYTRNSSRSGTGLGLTIVENLAKLLGARIEVTSEPGKGSIFTLTGEFAIKDSFAPLNLRNKSNIIARVGKKPAPLDKIGFKPRILLVEDDPIVQFVHKKMLTDLSCQVDVANGGNEALALLNNHDIAFVDVSLPDISGFKVIQQMREAFPNNKMPIVALTVYTGKEERLACLNAGANEFTSKPISSAYFKKLLMRYLTKRKP